MNNRIRVRPAAGAMALIALTACFGILAFCGARGAATKCMSIPEWVDILRVNGLYYVHDSEASAALPDGRLGPRIGSVKFKMADNACTDYKMKDGDAAFLPIGTEIHALKGYRPDFRLAAGGKIYEVRSNPRARTIGELMDIEGKVVTVSLHSGMDGKRIGDFTTEASEAFLKALLPLPLLNDTREMFKHAGSDRIQLALLLEDGTSSWIAFYTGNNSFSAGAYGTEELKRLLVGERERIKKAAGM
ncbi:hypothetical protein ACLBWT_01075 [Paenibacillus sp. D51F]